MHPKILFLLKKHLTSGTSYDQHGGGLTSKSGLYNSAKFVHNALHHWLGLESKIEVVVDGNAIDKEVHLYKPDAIILEALWCPPYKIKELVKLYPTKQWIVRIHSKTPFLANEGIALLWLKELSEIAKHHKNLFIAFNAKDTYKEFKEIGFHNSVYLPNFYFPDKHELVEPIDHPCFHDNHGVNIGCFGAIRPLKNQLIQAIAAIEYANKYHKKLYFHINAHRIEQKGEQVLKNIKALFENSKHELVSWNWLDHGTFVHLISKLNCTMQVSLSESFNIVAADSVYVQTPIVVSKEIDWMPFFCKADTDAAKGIANKIEFVLNYKTLCTVASDLCLDNFNLKSLFVWKGFFKK